jgi:hypothetical protein
VKGSVKAYCEVEMVSQIQLTPSVDQAETSQEFCQKEEADCCKKRIIKNTEKANSQSADLKKSEAEGDTLPLQISQQAGVVACSLLPKHIPSLIVAPPSADHADAVAEPIYSTFAAVAPSSELAFTHPVLPQNRSGTYLHCCVFLI